MATLLREEFRQEQIVLFVVFPEWHDAKFRSRDRFETTGVYYTLIIPDAIRYTIHYSSQPHCKNMGQKLIAHSFGPQAHVILFGLGSSIHFAT